MNAHVHADSCVCINLCHRVHTEVKGQLLSFLPQRASWGWNSGHSPWGKHLSPPSCLTSPIFNMLKHICLVCSRGGTRVPRPTGHERTTWLQKLDFPFRCMGLGLRFSWSVLAVSARIHLLDPTFNGWKNEKRVRAGIYILFSVFILP